MEENEISYLIRGAIFQVHRYLGPGLLESAYQAALAYELRKCDLSVCEQVALPMIYQEIKVGVGYRLDIVVNLKVVIEVKSLESLQNVHHQQLITYLKLSGMKLGLLVNFNVTDIATGIIRKVNNL
jgi:GxxExxY protein